MDRKSLTFEEAEGAHPLPSQLDRTHVTARVRATLWAILFKYIDAEIKREVKNTSIYDMLKNTNITGRISVGEKLGSRWSEIIRNEFSFHQGQPIDQFDGYFTSNSNRLRNIVFESNYVDLFGFFQWIVRDPKTPKSFVIDIAAALVETRSAYRLVDGKTLVPVSDPLAAQAIETALVDAKRGGLAGAQVHLRSALDYFGTDRYADSVRESIHAVEAVARTLDPGSKTLGEALAKLEKGGAIHPAMRSGFSALYGYANDEKGIRHALLDRDAANVDEAEALFMLGACAAFVSYLIAKGRAANLLP